MINKSKKPLVIISLLVLVVVISISVIFYARETKEKELFNVDQKVSTKESESDEEKIEENTDIIENIEDSKEQEEIKEEPKSDASSVSKQETNTTTNQNQIKTNETIKKDNTQNNNSTKNETSIPKQETTVSPVIEQPKTCTPKKFTMNFVRADFSSFSQCQEMGEKYKKGGYRYFCDDYQDDCGDTYYMLSLTKTNSSEELDYHNIPVPVIPNEGIPNE